MSFASNLRRSFWSTRVGPTKSDKVRDSKSSPVSSTFVPGASPSSPSPLEQLESEVNDCVEHLIYNLNQLNRYSRDVRRHSNASDNWPALKPNQKEQTLIIGQRNMEMKGITVLSINCRNRRIARLVVDAMTKDPFYRCYYFQTIGRAVCANLLKTNRC